MGNRDYLASAGAASPTAAGAAPSDPLLVGAFSASAGTSLVASSPLASSSSRTAKDRPWAYAYFLLLAITLAGGVYAAVHHSPEFGHILSDPVYLADPSHCPVPASGGGGRRSLLSGDADGPPPSFTPQFFVATASAYVALSVAGGVLLGVAAMCLFRRRPRLAVYGAIACQVGVPLIAAGGLLGAGAPFPAAAPLLFASALAAFIYYLYREQLALVAQLLGTAAQAISHVWGVVVAAAGLQLASALVCAPLAASALFAVANGSVARSPFVADVLEVVETTVGGDDSGGDPSSSTSTTQCLTAAGDPTLCCTWQVEPWAGALTFACAAALAWTSLLAFCLKTHVVSGAVAAWYYAPASPPEATLAATRNATLTAFRNAVGPSLGTNALAAWLLALIGWARSLLQRLREQARDSFLAQMVLSCVDLAYSVLEQLSKFGVVYSAITGDAFLDAARKSTALLSRNLLDTVAVWVFPASVVGFTNLALSAAWGAVAGLSSYHLAFAPAVARAAAAAGGAGAGASGGDSISPAPVAAVVVGAVAFLFATLALSFLASVLLSAVDAAYICFAIDRDSHQVTREDVHAVFVLLPSANKKPQNDGPGGGVVENPAGDMVFGNSARGAANAV